MSENPIPGLSAEANIFAKHPEGFGVHIKVISENGRTIVSNLDTAIAGLIAKGYTPDARPGPQEPVSRQNGNGRGMAPRGGSTRQRKPERDDVPECDECGGPCYDNRDNKRNPRGPDFKCKDKDCGAAGWESSSGDVRWQPGDGR